MLRRMAFVDFPPELSTQHFQPCSASKVFKGTPSRDDPVLIGFFIRSASQRLRCTDADIGGLSEFCRYDNRPCLSGVSDESSF